MFWQKETFLFGGLSPPNRKMTSLRPRRLCGEISILDKSDYEPIPPVSSFCQSHSHMLSFYFKLFPNGWIIDVDPSFF
jgi:hypothetical protein